ncbi:hypothetical protein H0I76_12030 [Limibaculum sp. M0105]|uniref:Lipoprotein n=1 Tax=Thermohalobaculum xanthum TaxID=2753746 RepID=A0A8J7SHU1_9RHOB|nr:hypothetical protein [Thermohalobaculum xanthum]MBK0399920.1 hypothetical protein [Thermohalobaculum xanthum]
MNRKPFARRVALVLTLALCGCAAPLPPALDEVITRDFAVGGGEWSSGGGITAVGKVVDRQGEVVACGAWTTDRQSALSILRNEDVIRAGALFVGGRRVVGNLGFMLRYEESARLLGRPASCVRTGLRWDPGYGTAETAFRFPRLTFAGGGGIGRIGVPAVGLGSGDTITFRQGPRPSPW